MNVVPNLSNNTDVDFGLHIHDEKINKMEGVFFKSNKEKREYIANRTLKLFRLRMNVPDYTDNEIRKSFTFSVLKRKFKNATADSYRCMIGTAPFVMEKTQEIFFPNKKPIFMEKLLMFVNQCHKNLEDGMMHCIWRMCKQTYRDSIDDVLLVLGDPKNDLTDVKYRLYDVLPDQFCKPPFDKDACIWVHDGSESVIQNDTTNIVNQSLIYSGYWNDPTFKWMVSGTLGTGMLVVGYGPYFPTASDNEVFADTPIPRLMKITNEFGIGDEKFSPFPETWTKKTFRHMETELEEMKKKRPTPEWIIRKMKEYQKLIGPFRRKRDMFKLYLHSIKQLVFLTTYYYPCKKYPKEMKEEDIREENYRIRFPDL